jgi:ABC-2 type transport system permease protein
MVNPFAGALNSYDAIIVDSESFSKQVPRLLLVAAWCVVTLVAARRAARQPRFR